MHLIEDEWSNSKRKELAKRAKEARVLGARQPNTIRIVALRKEENNSNINERKTTNTTLPVNVAKIRATVSL